MTETRLRDLSYCFLTALGIFGLLLGWFLYSSNSRWAAERCERRIQKTVNPISLQSWATTILTRSAAGETNLSLQPPAELIKIWGRGKPSIFLREGREGEEPYLYVFWGSGIMGHWGLSIGSPTFVPQNPRYGDRIWKPGIFFWRNLQ